MLAALAGGTTIHVPDVTAEHRWPAWQAEAVGAGMRSVLHVPMTVGGQTIGVLSLYNREPLAFSADDEAIAYILARHASVAVASARHDETMAQAIDARKLVGQAMGIVLERFDLEGDRAFEVLRRCSQDTNTKLRDVARRLVDTRKLPGWLCRQPCLDITT
ncbi:GAF and ANTAR domain-containing protein [Kribbella sp. CWNU-51]